MIFKARTIAYEAGSVTTRDLNQVPAKAPNGRPWEIRAIILKFFVSLTSAATSDAIAAIGWCTLLSSLEFRDNTGEKFLTDNPISGRALRALKEYIMRRAPVDPLLLAANSNATNTRTFDITIPLRMPFMDDEDDHLQLAARLRGGEVRLGWCASTNFGTGQVIGASTQVEILLDLVPARNLKARADLLYGTKVPDTFDRYKLPVVGKPLVLALIRPQATSNVFAATDFTDFELRGDELDINRQSIDNAVIEYNAEYLRDTASSKALVSGGAANDTPLYLPPNGCQLSEIPSESEPVITLVQGAGAPALTTVAFAYLISKPVDEDRFARCIEATDSIPLTREGVRAAFAADKNRKGKDGNAVDMANPVAGWLPRPVNIPIAKSVG